MATNVNANGFIATPRSGAIQLTSNNTAVDGSGVISTLATGAAAPGTRVLEIRAQAAMTGASANNQINLFRSFDGGTTWRLFAQVTITGNTPSATVQNASGNIVFPNLILASAQHLIGATQTVASQTTNIFWDGGDL